ncbi:hypothetical protein F4820DRAFT_157677 [Hypoxylon rubiginosum]|uniref:Uncharacterized protein n=1 Tax=Hypoxylon rubiginosum TaxID=110542 RepID=A0ACB9YJF7_9PEZI|nr:hypothetical protein F4820DRAFT_157677 [Hypoxylon rubiginosum]
MDTERLKQLEKAEEELRRRRERGRLAQRAFRKRQGKVPQDKRDETQRLKAAIGEIIRVASCDDRPELLRVIADAAVVAGLDTRMVADGSNGEDREQTSTDPSSPLPVSRNTKFSDGVLSIETRTDSQTSHDPADSESGWELESQMAALQKPRMILGRISPRLDYGLWFDTNRYVRIDDPPSDIVPYLGEGKSTFAGHIFWACGEYLLGLCRSVESNESANPRAAREATEKIWNMVQHSPPLHNVRYIRALAEARAEFRDRGYIEGNNPAGEVDSAKNIQNLVAADYESRGEDTTGWLTPPGVEIYLRKRMSQESFKHFEYLLQLVDSHHDCPLIELVRSLVQDLATSYICFGDGPRWHPDRISAIFSRKFQDAPAEIATEFIS